MDLITFLAIIGGVVIAEKLLKETPLVFSLLTAFVVAMAKALSDVADRAERERRKIEPLRNDSAPKVHNSRRLSERAEEPPDKDDG